MLLTSLPPSREPGPNYVSIKLLTDLLNNSLSTFIEHARLTKLWQCISVTQWQEERAFTIKSSNTGFTVWKLCYIHQERAQSTQIFKYFTPGTNSFAFGFRLLLTWGREKQKSSWIVIFISHFQADSIRNSLWVYRKSQARDGGFAPIKSLSDHYKSTLRCASTRITHPSLAPPGCFSQMRAQGMRNKQTTGMHQMQLLGLMLKKLFLKPSC